jgi:hypothetical protein
VSFKRRDMRKRLILIQAVALNAYDAKADFIRIAKIIKSKYYIFLP